MPCIAANLDLLFQDLPLPERFAAARAAGFDAVEMRDPYALSVRDLDRLLCRQNLHLAAIATPLGDTAAGERGFMGVPRRIADFRQGFDRAVAYAGALDVGIIHLMAGIAEVGRSEKMLKRNLAWAAYQAPEQILTLGPLSRVDAPGYAVESLDHALELMDWIGAPNLGLRFDLRHASEGAEDATAVWRMHCARTCHVDVAETDDDLTISFLEAVRSGGYDGVISAKHPPVSPHKPL